MTLGKYIRGAVAGAFLILSATASGAVAQSIVSGGQSFMKARLVPGRTEADGARVAALVLDLAPGWKTYWRNPGAAGIPPSFDWSHSANLASAEVMWPAPHLFESFGLTTIGYKEGVVFPVRLVPKDPGAPIELALNLAVGVCRDICVLEETALKARVYGAGDAAGAALVAEAERAVPRPAAELGLTGATCRISGAGKKRRFDAELSFTATLRAPVVLLEGPEFAWFGPAETTERPDGRLDITAPLSLLDETIWVNRADVRMTVLAGDFAADVRGCSAPAG